ncbi:hypothetical protein [Megasphaera hominis]|jgi:hypothetical protein|uniref:Uncharacterized protein n=1 Tax=Megasphaera hominis TaxID=159836 RepID=A0ABR6VFG2_9FIRM|nr:hypothetical protein [Megasphaera hominis]MBC3536012.1 hypothetical protein [Megasphaera hominis]
MYIMGMEKVLSRTYAAWKKAQKDKDDNDHRRGPRKGLPVGICLSLYSSLPAMG